MNELKCEIKRLEDRINEILSSLKLKQFKGESVTNKNVFEIELLRARIVSKVAYANENAIGFIVLAFLLSFSAMTIFNNQNNEKLDVIIFPIVVLGVWYFSDRRFRRVTERDTYLLELLDLLIKRKEEKNVEN